MPDADADAYVVVADVSADRAQSVVPGVAATGLDLEVAGRRSSSSWTTMMSATAILRKRAASPTGAAGLVHVGLGLEQQHPLAAEFAFADEALETLAPGSEALGAGDPIDGHEADVVAIAGMFIARISEADEKTSWQGRPVQAKARLSLGNRSAGKGARLLLGSNRSANKERGCYWATEAPGKERGCLWATEAPARSAVGIGQPRAPPHIVTSRRRS